MPATQTQIEWIRKTEAAQRLNVSTRSVLAMAAAGKIQRKAERDPATNQTVMLLHAGDIERIAFEREHPAQPVQGALTPALQTPPASAKNGEQGVLTMLITQAAQPAPALKPWLTLGEAAEYSGLPEAFLRGLVDSEKLLAFDVGVRPGGRYRVRRADLDALLPGK